jgi:Ca2+-binding EF-hand superfamily protein
MKTATIILVSALGVSSLGKVASAETPRSDAIAALIFSRLDADQDGKISTAEMTAHKTAQFARADRDGNGRVDAAELSAMHDRMMQFANAAGSAVKAGVRRMDSDGDGALSLAEYTDRAPFFVLLDADGDGEVARAEFDRARAAFAD